MPRSAQLIEILKTVVAADMGTARSVIDFFTSHAMAGGWEAWLQTVYARAVFEQFGAGADVVRDFDRERAYPPLPPPAPAPGRCDLWFQGATGIWIEFKTQRNANYATTVTAFGSDVAKIRNLPEDFRRSNVLLAVAVLRLSNNDRLALDALRVSRPAGALRYYRLAAGAWSDVTDTIRTAGTNAIVIAAFSLA